MAEHVVYKCPQPCDTPHCQFCEGGLFVCTDCGGGEGSLPSECPGKPMVDWQQDAVFNGSIDFKDGKWKELKT